MTQEQIEERDAEVERLTADRDKINDDLTAMRDEFPRLVAMRDNFNGAIQVLTDLDKPIDEPDNVVDGALTVDENGVLGVRTEAPTDEE